MLSTSLRGGLDLGDPGVRRVRADSGAAGAGGNEPGELGWEHCLFHPGWVKTGEFGFHDFLKIFRLFRRFFRCFRDFFFVPFWVPKE